jgi:putative ABC transport system permease protein
MFKNYFMIAFRNLVRYKSFSLLNIFGLTIGLSCSLLIFLWVQDENSFDKFNVNAKQIYRITGETSDTRLAVTPVPAAPVLGATIPEIAQAVRLEISGRRAQFTVGNQTFDENQSIYAENGFLQMFTYPLLYGDPLTALSTADGIVITETTARKFFGSTNVLGKIIRVNNDIQPRNLIVKGVLKDIPANSHLQFNILLPYKLFEQTIDFDNSWGNWEAYTYIRTQHLLSSITKLQQEVDAVFQKNSANDPQGSIKDHFYLQPLEDIHLRSGRLMLDVDGQGNIQHVRIFSLIALFILGIACINFMNLATALSGQRAKEVGLRKSIGAVRGQLMVQFISESILLALIALVAALIITPLLLPFFNTLAGKHIGNSFLHFNNLLLFLGVAILTGIIAGSYPSFFLSAFKPVQVLKGVKTSSTKGLSLRNGLVVFQFVVSVVLIVSTLVVYQQLRYINNRYPGFDKENLLYVQMPAVGDSYKNLEALKSSMAQLSGVSDYTVTNYLPVYLPTGTNNIQWPGKDPSMNNVVPHLSVDAHFLQTFRMQMKTGRFFSDDFKGDNDSYVVNETALKMMKVDADAAIGLPLELNGHKGKIIGVIKDFNFKPVQQAIEPLVMKTNNFGGYLVVRTANIEKTMGQVKKAFDKVYPGIPFTYKFLDQDLDRLYASEQQMGQLFNVFALLSILVSCLGLFGLAAFTARKRLREIGIRKVLGATETNIMTMLSKDFLKLVLIALVFAFPLAAWAMEKWLQNFVYRIALNPVVFIAAGCLAILIAFLTVSYQSVKAAWSNPVKSLKAD